MKTLICVTICLFSLCQAYPAGEVSTLDEGPSNASSVVDECDASTWNKANQTQIREQIINVIKGLLSTNMTKSHTERWYNISSSDRKCIIGAQQTAWGMWFTGYFTVDSCITYAKQKCPNASTEIDTWLNESIAHKANASASWNATYSKLPSSVQSLLKNLNANFSSLRQSHSLLNQAATQAALLPLVKQFLAISQSDLDEVVAVFPKTEVILGSDGNLTKPFFVLVEALENKLSNSTVNQTAVNEAKAAFAHYGQEKCREYVPVVKDYVNKLPKPELSDEAHAGIESSVGGTIDAVAGSASSATGSASSS